MGLMPTTERQAYPPDLANEAVQAVLALTDFLAALGHEVKLMPAQYVKPYVKRGKNDAADAEAICEAVTRPTMRYVGVKSPDQQATMMLHRVRKILTRQRTQISNALRAHMAEFGIIGPVGRVGLDRLIAVIADQDDARMPDEARACLAVLCTQLDMVKEQILDNDRRILADARKTEAGRRLMKITLANGEPSTQVRFLNVRFWKKGC